MSNEKIALISTDAIQERINEIHNEENELVEREYRYGYVPDKMYMADLYQERTKLERVLSVLSEYCLEEIQRELDARDPLQKVDVRADGLGKYSFEVLGHAEKVLQHADRELQARVDFGERIIQQWENTFNNLSWEEDKAVYRIIRDKDVPFELIEEKIRQCLIRMNEDLLEDLCDIGGRRCIRVDAWKDGEDSFVLGNAVNEGEFWYAGVNEKISNCFEYDFRPTRVQVMDDWLNLESERELNRQEALAEGFDMEREVYRGNPDYYKFFYAGEQDAEAQAFQKETGWHMIWGSDYEGLNGDTWVVFRDVEDLPGWLRDYARTAEDLSKKEISVTERVEEELVDIGDLEFEDGYLHFRVTADDYSLEGLFRLFDPENGPDMTLVSIDYGYLHPIIERQWSRIEDALYGVSLDRYHDILDKSEAFKEKIIAAMEAAGYTYDVLESYEGWETFYGEGGARVGFDRFHEVAEWLEGVVFDDPDISRRVEEILRPESFDTVLRDAEERAGESPKGGREQEISLG